MLKNMIAFAKHKSSLSMGFLFSIGSLLLGIWVAALPSIKHRLHFTDGTLGLSLLLSPAGSLAAVVLSSIIFSRIQAGKALMLGCSLQCMVYVAQVLAVNRAMFWIALFSAGFIGCLNGIASNAIVNTIEKKNRAKNYEYLSWNV